MSIPDTLYYALLRARWDDAALETAQAMVHRQPIDWPGFFRLAEARALSPLLYSVTRDHHILPTQVQLALQARYVRNAARTISLLATLHAIVDAFSRHAIEVILLKGAALAENIYPNPALRPMMDLDLLIPRAQLNLATRILAAMGFSSSTSEPRSGATLDFESQIRFHRPDSTQTLVELHWELLDAPYYQGRLDTAWFWESARPTRDGRSRMLGPEAQVLHLCAHMMLHHGAAIWLGMHDIAEVCYHDAQALDWDLLLAKASAMHLVLPLQHILPRVKRHWAAPIPEPIIQRLQHLSASDAERHVFRWLIQQRNTVAHHFLADILTMPSAHQRWRYALAHIFPSPTYIQNRYRVASPWLIPYFYLQRWLRGMTHMWYFIFGTNDTHEDGREAAEGAG